LDASLLKKIPLFAEVPDDDLRKVATVSALTFAGGCAASPEEEAAAEGALSS